MKDVPSYEMMYLMIPNLEDEAYEAVNQRFSDLIAENGGRIGKIDVWGKRRLAMRLINGGKDFIPLSILKPPRPMLLRN